MGIYEELEWRGLIKDSSSPKIKDLLNKETPALTGPLYTVEIPGAENVLTYDENGEKVYRYYAPALESVKLTAATSIGESAFANCRSLKSVELGSGITHISAQAFFHNVALTDVNLDGVTSIGTNAFNHTALTAVDLSAAEDIGTYAFVYNDGLTSVTLNPNGTILGEGVFSYCPALAVHCRRLGLGLNFTFP